MSPHLRGRIADGLLAAAMVAVPLASSSAFVDQYTTVKWYLVHVVAAAWLLLEVWVCRQRRMARLCARTAAGVRRLCGAGRVERAARGTGAGPGPLVDRGACAVLALCAFWHFARNGGRTLAIITGLSVSAAITIALGLAQASGRALPAALTAREGPAALFGNVNMTAQFLGLALLLVLSTPAAREGPRGVAWNAVRVALGLTGAAYLYVASSRSVLLALAVSVACVAWVNRRRRVLALAAMTASMALLALAWWQPWRSAIPRSRRGKPPASSSASPCGRTPST